MVSNFGYYLEPGIPTLATELKSHGYTTAAIVSAFPLDSRFGLDNGFDYYNDDLSPPPGTKGVRYDIHFNERSAKSTTDCAVKWIRENSKKPFFLWVHYFDPHEPYAPPEPFSIKYKDDLYAGEIAYMDEQIGHLVSTLREQNDDPLIVAVGDHGEALGQHGEKTHGMFIYDEVVRIPLIISGGPVDKSIVLKEQVKTIDIFPTIFTLLNLSPPEYLPGQDLSSSLISGKEPGFQSVYLESFEGEMMFNWSPLRGIRASEWKYIDAPKPELYHLTDDPLEENNLLDSNESKVTELKSIMKKILADGKKMDISSILNQDRETIKRLESLGYLNSPSRGSLSEMSWEDRIKGKPDPKDMIHLMPEIDLLNTQFNAGEFSDALETCKKILKVNPMNAEVRFKYAQSLHFLKRYSESESVYLELVDKFPNNAQISVGLANLYLDQGQFPKAVPWLEETLNRDPSNTDCRFMLAKVYKQIGELDKAENMLTLLLQEDNMKGQVYLERSYIRQAKNNNTGALDDKYEYIKIYPDSAPGWLEIGILYLNMDQKDKGLECLLKALKFNPEYLPALDYLGLYYTDVKDYDNAWKYWTKALTINPNYKPAKEHLEMVFGKQ